MRPRTISTLRRHLDDLQTMQELKLHYPPLARQRRVMSCLREVLPVLESIQAHKDTT